MYKMQYVRDFKILKNYNFGSFWVLDYSFVIKNMSIG